MKKETLRNIFIYSILILTIFSVFAGFVGADTKIDPDVVAQNTQNTLTGVAKGTKNILEILFLDTFKGDPVRLTQVFFSILLGIIVYSIVKKFHFLDENKFLIWGVTITITILALMGLPVNFLLAVRTNYGAMGAALLMAIPFIVLAVFTFDPEQSVLVSRITWIFYTLYYFAMYISEIINAGVVALMNGQTLPYIIGIIAGILVILFMKNLRKFVIKGEIDNLTEKMGRSNEKRIALRKHEENMANSYSENYDYG